MRHRSERPICECGKTIHYSWKDAERLIGRLVRIEKDRDGSMTIYQCQFNRIHVGHEPFKRGRAQTRVVQRRGRL